MKNQKESGYMSEYIEDVSRYDDEEDEEVVEKIVKNIGIEIRNRD